jgi:hypothetical protein
VIDELATGAGEPHAARQPHEELRAELLFEAAQMTREGRLGDAEMLRGARDAAQVGNLDEIADAAQILGIAPSRNRPEGPIPQ